MATIKRELDSDSDDLIVAKVSDRHLQYVRSRLIHYISETKHFSAEIHHTRGKPPHMVFSIGAQSDTPNIQGRHPSAQIRTTNKILVKNLPTFYDEQHLQMFFEYEKGQIGQPIKKIILNRRTRSAVVEFESSKYESRAEATVDYLIENISDLNETKVSEKFMVRNLPWTIKVMQTTKIDAGKHKQKFVGFFLKCHVDSQSTSWSCNAVAEFKLLNQRLGLNDLTQKYTHLFCSKENDFGYQYFISWNMPRSRAGKEALKWTQNELFEVKLLSSDKDLLNPYKGYIKDGKILLQVHVRADPPREISLLEPEQS